MSDGIGIKNKKKVFDDLRDTIEKLLLGPGEKKEKLRTVCELLSEKIEYYDWVGFYLTNGNKRELILGPYVGEVTEHTKIRFGEGICGLAAEKERTIIVQDVSRETNYLSCAPEVKSELVVPIFRSGKVIGEIDIDSHLLSPFSWEDRDFLEYLGSIMVDMI
jgi:GAF domain-containing protein